MVTPVESLTREIRAAFAGANRPPGLFLRPGLGDERFFVDLEASYTAQGDPPDVAFLRAHGHDGRYQRPETLRWMWRSLLLASLADGEHHSALYWLRPNPCAVLTGMSDASRDALRSLLPAERLAIAHYLGHVLETSPHYAHRSLAAQAIVWEWSEDPATHAEAARFRAAARAHQRPLAADPEDEALIVQIEQAFADTPAPRGALMLHICEECADYALELAGASWRTLTPEFVSLNGTAYSMATAETFRYFLPAALIHSVLGRPGNVDVVFHLARATTDPSSYREKCREAARTFAPAERAAIIAYLRRQAVRGSHDREAIENALREFWEPMP